jgi:hypothetical protein
MMIVSDYGPKAIRFCDVRQATIPLGTGLIRIDGLMD